MESYTSDSSDSDSNNSDKLLDFSYMFLEQEVLDHNLDVLLENCKKPEEVEKLFLHHNNLVYFPENVVKFTGLCVLDISNNGLKNLPDIFEHVHLTHLIARNNCLDDRSLPKSFTVNATLKEINLSGNRLTQFPQQLFSFVNLKYLYLGGNHISMIPRNIWKLKLLQVLSIGGNRLMEIPATVGQLMSLQALILCDNLLESIPSDIANLRQLKTLALHKNRIKTLPPEIVNLKYLTELSLRDNPLVVRFVSDMTHDPGTLMELAARVIKLHDIKVNAGQIPSTVIEYLNSGHHCVNPKCKGVYFDNRVEHVKFVDFCGKYRIPLLQYLCSSKCATSRASEIQRPGSSDMMKKVLLG